MHKHVATAAGSGIGRFGSRTASSATTALLFPGQGSQHVGMGASLARHPAAVNALVEAEDVLQLPVRRLMREGPQEELTATENTQPILVAHSIAMFRAWAAQRASSAGPLSQVAFALGHSLGEFTALCAVGAISYADTLRLVRARGIAMRDALLRQPDARHQASKMAALLGADTASAEYFASQAESDTGLVCEIANINAHDQVVLSGHAEAVDAAIALTRSNDLPEGIRKCRARVLDVSAPFHCRLMQPVRKELEMLLQDVAVSTPSISVISNVTAEPHLPSPQAIKASLAQQAVSPVRWNDSIRLCLDKQVHTFVEFTDRPVLSNLVARIAADAGVGDVSATVAAIPAPEDIPD